MANIKSLEMAKAVFSHEHIETRKALMGLSSKTVYTPTGSTVAAKVLEYAPDMGERLERLLNGPLPTLVEEVQAGRVQPVPVGHMRLEVVTSNDGQFAAVQLFRFVNFGYQAVTEPAFYEGEQASWIARIF